MKNNSMDYTGKRIVLIRMDDNHGHDTQVIPPMTTGIVESVDDIGQLHVRWDGINSSLAVIPKVDLFRVLPDEE